MNSMSGLMSFTRVSYSDKVPQFWKDTFQPELPEARHQKMQRFLREILIYVPNKGIYIYRTNVLVGGCCFFGGKGVCVCVCLFVFSSF